MRVYKPSGIEWLGEIPQGWEIKKLKYIGEIFGGVTGKTIKDFSKEYKLNFKPYITFTNVCNNAVINPDLMEYVFIDSKEKQNKVLKNDILFLQSSETFEDVGKSAIYLNDDEVYLNTFCKGFRIEREAYPMYLNYLLSSLSYKRYFMSVCSGFTRINLRQEHFLDIPLILPPLQEQKEIAEFLDKKCEKIQNYINKKQKLITLLQEKKQALINEAVCGRVACHTERSEVSTTAYKPSGIEYLGLIPHHWEVARSGLIYKNISSGTTPQSDNDEYYKNGNIFWINSGDLNDSVLTNSKNKITQKAMMAYSALKISPKGSLIIAMYGATIGKVSILGIDACTNQACCVLCESKYLNTRFVFYYFIAKRQDLISMAYGGGQPNISQDIIKNFKIPLPPLQEQKQIANFLDEKCEKINSVIEKTKKQIELVKEYKNTLINEAVCGRINLERK
ncbi:restriction endonuclease subunit S [Campylobacter upsaliensis]|uniref:Type I restriction modification DNA specificity domain-containing protein n=1 Tax=Campylobacter upsaliensis TaxID=28080 RepID=A0A448KNW8_CAMUP|nr:restriction endonuclease subunit S [Campylobacter upsaliensis]MCA5588832.1 restriction endonuclease subunit S [Campylobacter upsaliensis]VEG85065.1 type I restriction modification DNA specificity domain-containing protein [Campylobacter upsaliensis]